MTEPARSKSPGGPWSADPVRQMVLFGATGGVCENFSASYGWPPSGRGVGALTLHRRTRGRPTLTLRRGRIGQRITTPARSAMGSRSSARSYPGRSTSPLSRAIYNRPNQTAIVRVIKGVIEAETRPMDS